jgi:hypothetical protein
MSINRQAKKNKISKDWRGVTATTTPHRDTPAAINYSCSIDERIN